MTDERVLATQKAILDYYKLPAPTSVPVEVPDSRIGLANLFHWLGFTRGVEIGVQAGKYSRVLGLAMPDAQLYGIDPWEEYDELPVRGLQEDQDRGFLIAQETVPANVTLIRKKSLEAVKDFPDGYFDFVYVDGNHEYVHAAMDIHYWLPKIRIGGILAGHDYRPYRPSSFNHVYHVVNSFTYAYRISPWFVTSYACEHVRSFFWVREDFGYRR